MKPTTRQKILDYLKRNKTVSSREVARALHMTPANARHHLGILASDGRVELISQQQIGRGRPEKIYRLAGTLAGDNLAALADALLAEAGSGVNMEALGKLIASENPQTGGLLLRRLESTVSRLNEMHYQARWEAGAEGPRIILGYCPYSAIIRKHPGLCQMDKTLFETLIGSGVHQTVKLEIGAGARPFCVFIVEER